MTFKGFKTDWNAAVERDLANTKRNIIRQRSDVGAAGISAPVVRLRYI